MNKLYDAEFRANLNGALRAFTSVHKNLDISITSHYSNDEYKKSYMHIEMADFTQRIFSAIDIDPTCVPGGSEYASDFWTIIFNDLYDRLMKEQDSSQN